MDPAAAANLTTTFQLNHPDSANSSPRSRPETWDDQPLPPLPGAKLRLMCSFGGHIIPRPHDKSLCYVGGETRIVVVDRHSSLADLHSRLSNTLLNGRHFTLKYQLPTEDLDSLISLATEEDLENMIEEYERSTTSPLKPSRLRLFLFPNKPETAASMGSLLDDAKSETWFVDALNGSGLLPRGLSDSAADKMLDVLQDHTAGMQLNDADTTSNSNNLEPSNDQTKNSISHDGNEQQVIVGLLLDSPSTTVVETSSSFGSSSSSPSMSNLPPIKVRAQDHGAVGLDDQQFSSISQMNATSSFLPQEDDDKSDHGPPLPPNVSTGLRKPPLPLQPVQRKLVDIHNLPSPTTTTTDSKNAAAQNLPSPDSVASDCSITSAGSSLSKHTMIYQDATQEHVNRENMRRVPAPSPSPPPATSDQKESQVSAVQQFEDPVPLQSHQQFNYIHPNPSPHQYYTNIHSQSHHPVASSNYYQTMYHHLPPQTQTQQYSLQHQTDPQQYAMYLLPPTGYDAPVRPLTPPPNPVGNMMMYANATTTTTTPNSAAAAPMFVQVPAHQYQQQYNIGGFSQPVHDQSHAIAANSNNNYGQHEYMQDQVYYAPPPQYQTITPAAHAMLLSQSQASAQLPTADNTAQQ